ncbi:MAG: AtpZ/AtpI family protein [Devosia sp.]|nr:AtpZ/AtpI family protein [Devosia sp.]
MKNPHDAKRPDGDDDGSSPTGDLAARIARAQANRAAGTSRPDRFAAGDATNMGRAFRLGTEFIAAILVGAVAGYLLDQWLKTTPWLMLVLLLIGFAAGVVNVTRAAAEMSKAAPPPASGLNPSDDDDEEE